MAMSDCPKCWDTPCTCGHQNPAVFRVLELERQLEDLRLAGNNLIYYIKQRYRLQSDDELTCPFTRALARELKGRD